MYNKQQEYMLRLSREILEVKENFQTKKFENNDELIEKVNKKLEIVEKRLNRFAKRYDQYVKLSFGFKKPFRKFTKKDEISAKEQARRNQEKYTYTCEVYRLEDKFLEEKDEKIYPENVWELYPFFDKAKDYENYVKILEPQIEEALFKEHIRYTIYKDSSFMDDDYDAKHGADWDYKLDRFPNDDAFIKKINEILEAEANKLNEKYANEGIYCGISFDFYTPYFVETNPEILKEMTKEEIAEMEAPKYGFYCAIFKSEEDPLAEEEELFEMEDCRGHDTKEAYEKYAYWFCKKVDYELTRSQLILTVRKAMPDILD